MKSPLGDADNDDALLDYTTRHATLSLTWIFMGQD